MKKLIVIPVAALFLLGTAGHVFAQKKPVSKPASTSTQQTQQSSQQQTSQTQSNSQDSTAGTTTTQQDTSSSSNPSWSEILKMFPNFFTAPAENQPSTAQDSTAAPAASNAKDSSTAASSAKSTKNFLTMPDPSSAPLTVQPSNDAAAPVPTPAAPAKSKLAIRSSFTSSGSNAYKTPAPAVSKPNPISSFFSNLHAQQQSSSYNYEPNTYSPETTKKLNSIAGLLGISGLGFVLFDRKNKNLNNLNRTVFNV